MFIRYNVLILLMPAITFLHVQNIQILEMYFAKQYKIFLIVTISLILIYYSMVVLIMDLILKLKYLKHCIYIYIEATKRFIKHCHVCSFVNISTPVPICNFFLLFSCFSSFFYEVCRIVCILI